MYLGGDPNYYISERIYLLTERWTLKQLQYILWSPWTLHFISNKTHKLESEVKY
jgi:hypothetical protein